MIIGMFEVISSKLTDGSLVYNVRGMSDDGKYTVEILCESESAADDLCEQLEGCSVNVEPGSSQPHPRECQCYRCTGRTPRRKR